MVGVQSDRDAPAPARASRLAHRGVRRRRMGNRTARQLPHPATSPGPAFDPSGEVAWQFQTEGQILGAPAVVDGLVFVGSNDRRIVALDEESGSVVWEHPLDIQPNSVPTVAGDFLYWGLRDGRLIALDYKTGDTVWTYKTGRLPSTAHPPLSMASST